MPTIQLKEAREKLSAKQADLAKVFEEAKVNKDGLITYDLTRVKSLGKDLTTHAVAEKIQAMNAELNDLGHQVEALEAVEKAFQAAAPVNPMHHPDGESDGGDRGRGQIKTLGQLITHHALFKAWRAGQKDGTIFIPEFGLAELKTLFQTSAGWAAESIRTGLVVEAVTRPIQILDIIPMARTNNAAVVYMEETTRTHAAAEKAEAAAYAESTFVLTERSETVRKITDSVPVTDEQMEDVAQAESYLDSRLRFGLRQRLDNQVIQGSGVAPNLTGVVNKAGIQTQALGGDPVPDAVYKAMTLVRVTGRAIPSHVLMHPNDEQAVRLLRTADGIYIWGSPSETGAMRIWGLPLIVSDVLTENTGIVGAFRDFCRLYERRGIEVTVGYVNDDFTKGKKTIRADLRVAFAIERAAAFCTVTGI